MLVGAAGHSDLIWTKPGEVKIVVVDRDSRPLSGVAVTLSAADGSYARPALVTDSGGHAVFAGVGPGEYVVRFDLSGFVSCSLGPFRMRSEATQNPVLPEFVVMMNPQMVVG